MAKIFTQIPEELFEHPLFQDASINYRMVMIAILRHTAFEDQPKTGLKKGQCRKSIREISVEANVSKSTVEHAINHFMGINGHKKIRRDVASGLPPILARQSAGRNAGQEKCVYNILLKGFYEIGETVGETVGEDTGETVARQSRDSLPRENAYTNKEAKKLPIPNNNPQPPKTTKEMLKVLLLQAGIEEKHHENVLSKGFEKVRKALEHMSEPDFVISKTPIQALYFIIKNEAWNWKNKEPILSNRDKILEKYKDGRLYNGALCEINTTRIWFSRGMLSDGAEFEKNNFWPQFTNVLTRFGIENLLKIDKNAKVG